MADNPDWKTIALVALGVIGGGGIGTGLSAFSRPQQQPMPADPQVEIVLGEVRLTNERLSDVKDAQTGMNKRLDDALDDLRQRLSNLENGSQSQKSAIDKAIARLDDLERRNP